MAHLGGCTAGAMVVFAMKGSLAIEIETDQEGNVQITHEDDKPVVTETAMFEQVLDLHPVKVVVEEVLGSDAQVFCSECEDSLDLSKQIGDRLIRCQHCGEIVYVDGYLIVRSQMRVCEHEIVETV